MKCRRLENRSIWPISAWITWARIVPIPGNDSNPPQADRGSVAAQIRRHPAFHLIEQLQKALQHILRGCRQLLLLEELPASDTEQVAERMQDPLPVQHCLDAILDPRSDLGQR